jgi:hypothetical protein
MQWRSSSASSQDATGRGISRIAPGKYASINLLRAITASRTTHMKGTHSALPINITAGWVSSGQLEGGYGYAESDVAVVA